MDQCDSSESLPLIPTESLILAPVWVSSSTLARGWRRTLRRQRAGRLRCNYSVRPRLTVPSSPCIGVLEVSEHCRAAASKDVPFETAIATCRVLTQPAAWKRAPSSTFGGLECSPIPLPITLLNSIHNCLSSVENDVILRISVQ